MASSSQKIISPALFPPTAWTLIRRACRDSDTVEPAMEAVCKRYWEPIRKYIVALGCVAQEAEDVTQGFFASFLATKGFDDASPDKGSLRSLLKKAVRNHLIDHWRWKSAEKRGGGASDCPLECAEEVPESGHELAVLQYDQDWAFSILNQALEALEASYKQRNKLDLFTAIKPGLLRAGGLHDYSAVAANLGVSEAQVRLAVFRSRQRLGLLLRQVVAATVDADEVESELHYLLEVIVNAK